MTKSVLYAGIFSLFLVSCQSVTRIPSPSVDGRRYKIVKTQARATSYGFKLLGLIPVVNPSYSDLTRQIYDAAGQKFEGRSIALNNQLEERNGNWFIAFSVPKVTLSADIIEFTDLEPQRVK